MGFLTEGIERLSGSLCVSGGARGVVMQMSGGAALDAHIGSRVQALQAMYRPLHACKAAGCRPHLQCSTAAGSRLSTLTRSELVSWRARSSSVAVRQEVDLGVKGTRYTEPVARDTAVPQ